MTLRVVILDTTERGAPWLSMWWRLGSYVNGTREDLRVASWAEAYALLAQYRQRIDDLQVWGHGDDGRPVIDGRTVDLVQLAGALRVPAPKGTVWWRSCEVHRGDRGARFALDATRILGRASVGHCEVISSPSPLWQRSICALRPGETPWWEPAGRGLSGCSTLRMSVPATAYRPPV